MTSPKIRYVGHAKNVMEDMENKADFSLFLLTSKKTWSSLTSTEGHVESTWPPRKVFLGGQCHDGHSCISALADVECDLDPLYI